ncbi:DUF3293 domain-containing protein [Haliea sp.]
MSGSVIDAAIVQAYIETEYRVFANPPFILRIGESSAELVALHERHQVDCSAFVTACNPFSRPIDESVNRERQVVLAEDLEAQGLVFVPGAGQHPSNRWPAEESLLVLGLDLDASRTLGVQYQQNAIVWSGADGIAQLILLR